MITGVSENHGATGEARWFTGVFENHGATGEARWSQQADAFRLVLISRLVLVC